ncbi:DNA-directed RNA polymerase subunit K [Saccharolobus islandicus]|uniref:DNA-directed RNA polymerase subunit Rpo6 n=4 Tax=Saccharolobus islandicus TaxID=43080 RepID=RPO6_SACI3|nr:DNA-directed RNA polymerase subunit K [Sulfolobus islandicus]C3MUV8.1 RecName: Full=DNA-directed RNA polymerase subunit Rpo6; AltName: Full=DNA-directed RNA polymerase subunit K [Sulfolobus islandicus M.14.25]C3N5H2.1 RecName: Full=DNA-directed RNA polymerase subunit Rpo6; AltName: Full=DNA-directed RNA polymerase subunit K [Sulfolobus islandicus M.16.27]C4KH38.1 RecName: Full=DNA-directed RNA polymerase subunit Rpo6; AltName: Full=DNA-directed RNA polymerase subunit K [Sulfolobus islandicus 
MGLERDGILSQDLHFNEVFVSLWQNKLTRYEIARVISARALQLAMGAPALIDINNISLTDVISIAEEEFKRGVLPITIRRRLPNGKIILLSLRKS